MKFYSTNNRYNRASFETALLKGLADDGGLYMPVEIPSLEKDFFRSIEKYSFREIAFRITEKFVGDEINHSELGSIIGNAINFPAPVLNLTGSLSVLELFHGPTLAFKDFGARFMARTMEYFIGKKGTRLNILVATSGDTGSAVANGFYETPGINVFILYPKGKVSLIQEMQLTTLDKNITALEIDGTFDDCQRLVKSAFVDPDLKKKSGFSSANSINIARLLPQTFYYFEAFKQLGDKKNPLLFSVPSGNLGNLTAGLIAWKMGLPVSKLIAALNINKVFAEFIESGSFNPRPSVLTLSNAMDVGNPSNLFRIIELYAGSITSLRNDIYPDWYDDDETLSGIKEVYEKYNYIIDPHGAVGYLALRDYIEKERPANYSAVVLETAHPAKFREVVEAQIGKPVELPERLALCLKKEKRSIGLSKDFTGLKDFLLSV